MDSRDNLGGDLREKVVTLGQGESAAAAETRISDDAACAQELEDQLLAQALQEAEDADARRRDTDVEVWGTTHRRSP
jgi:hypothetical protein